ncbi:PadR family transcriptional regulator [Nocardioides nanhaiensis]|uniref:Transcription regulator PadR N-terminal domain-containing protein n=1 Tax=Nocardioides nanhaiensis TaxID=1476871 RepID=A0ABP8VP92_9ACTN
MHDHHRRRPGGWRPEDLARTWAQNAGSGWGSWGAWGGGADGGDGPWGGPGRRGPGGRGGPGGPPPWLAGLFGAVQPERGRGPRVRRGDVRAAILDVLAEANRREEPINGYQVIQQIARRSHDAWRPSPGSVYPTIQQLQDEGLVVEDEERGRRALTLTTAGLAYVGDHADELAAVWAPFERPDGSSRAEASEGHAGGGERADVKAEIGQVMSAVWQILTQGSEQQRRAAVSILVETRRKLYGVLADGDEPRGITAEEDDEQER